MASIKLGDLLLKAKVLNESQLKAALAEQQKWGGKLGEILVRMNILTEDMLVKALSKQLNLPAVNLDQVQSIPTHVRAKIPVDVSRDLTALPLQLRDEGRTLVVAMAEPQNLKHVDTLRSVSRCRIMVQIAGRSSIARAFARFYEGETEISDSESSFKFLDAQGNTVVKSGEEVEAESPRAARPAPAPVAAPLPRASLSDAPAVTPGTPGRNPAELLTALEDSQRKEVAALKAMVELLIEKGIFSRDEYLARVRK